MLRWMSAYTRKERVGANVSYEKVIGASTQEKLMESGLVYLN